MFPDAVGRRNFIANVKMIPFCSSRGTVFSIMYTKSTHTSPAFSINTVSGILINSSWKLIVLF